MQHNKPPPRAAPASTKRKKQNMANNILRTTILCGPPMPNIMEDPEIAAMMIEAAQNLSNSIISKQQLAKGAKNHHARY